jgi:predicted nuclease of predicted toxin-antitoxin system
VTRFLWDENTSRHILRAVRRLRSDLDIVTVQQIDLAGAPDSVVVDRAVADGRVLVTHDRTTIPALIARRQRAGQPVPGVVVIRLNKVSIGDVAKRLVFLTDAAEAADWQNPIFMP